MEIVFSVIVGFILVLSILALALKLRRLDLGLGLKIVLVLLLAGAIGIMLFTPQFFRRLKTGLTTNVAVTSPDPEFPELKTRFYNQSPAQVFNASVEVIRGLPDWQILRQDKAAGTIVAAKKVFIFTDSVAVKIRDDGGRTRVDLFSKSRVGKGDFGENRRHIAQFLQALDRKMIAK